jgi:outer membrane receptor for ferrienterochelin and colicins
MKTRLTTISLLLVLLSSVIFAQEAQGEKKLSEMNLEDLLNMEVTTASKKAEKTSDAPGVITTITAEEIKYFGANSLIDVLQRVTSVQPMSSHLYQDGLTIMRGDLKTLYDNHVLILMDGRPVREGVTGGSNASVYSAFPIDMIERIEIIRGPGSVLYGSNAFVGVINIITKSEAKESYIKIKGTDGTFGTINSEVTGTIISGGLNAKISARIEDINGWDYSAMSARPNFPNIQMNRKMSQNNLALAADVNYSGLSLQLYFTHDKQESISTVPYSTTPANNQFERLFANLGYSFKLGETWDASVNFTTNSSILWLGNSGVTRADSHHSNDYLGEFTLNGEVVKDLNITFGGVYESRNKFAATPTAPLQPYDLSQISSYLQADYRPIEPLKLIAGAQVNKPQDRDWDIVPRVGAIYNFTPELGLKTLLSSAFRSPWPTEQLISSSAVIVGNKDLTPEKIQTLDVQLFYSTKKVDISLTYFNSLYTNLITRLPVPGSTALKYSNAGNQHMNGVEFEGKITVISNTFITGSATYQNDFDQTTNPAYVPSFMGKIGAFTKVYEGLTVGVFNTLFGQPQENTGVKLNPDAKTVDLLSVNVNYKLPISLPVELNVYVQNLLNSDYFFPEFSRGWVNTLPVGGGTAVYATVGVKF